MQNLHFNCVMIDQGVMINKIDTIMSRGSAQLNNEYTTVYFFICTQFSPIKNHQNCNISLIILKRFK